MKTQPKQKQNPAPKQINVPSAGAPAAVTVGNPDGMTLTNLEGHSAKGVSSSDALRTRDARGRWAKLPSANAATPPPASPQNPIQLPRRVSRPPEPAAAPVTANPPPQAPDAPPAPANPPGASTVAPKRKRARAPRQRRPDQTLTLAGVECRPATDAIAYCDADSNRALCRTMSGHWYLCPLDWRVTRGCSEEPFNERHLELLSVPWVVQWLLRSNLAPGFWEDFAPYLPELFPAAVAPGLTAFPPGFVELAAGFFLPPAALAHLLCVDMVGEQPKELRVIHRNAPGPRQSRTAATVPADPAAALPAGLRGTFAALLAQAGGVTTGTFLAFLAGETLALAAADPVFSRDLLRRFRVPLSTPAAEGAPASVERPWRLSLTVPPTLDGLFRAMLADDEVTAVEWVRSEMVSSVEAWLTGPSFRERMGTLGTE